MPRSTRVFKKVKNKGNRFYRTYPVPAGPRGDESTSTAATSISTPPSCSKKKLECSKDKYETSENHTNVNVIIDLDILQRVFSECVSCRLCGGQIKLDENTSKRNGLVSSLTINCENCKSVNEFHTSNKCKDSELFETNIRYFYGMRCVGKGFAAGKVLAGLLNLATPPTNVSKYTAILGESVKLAAEQTMKDAVTEAVHANGGNSDIAVGFDGTWQKRGYKSKNGCSSVTSIDTGNVLDVDIFSKYCQKCTMSGKGNEHEGECHKNYEGSSGGMETAAAVSMFHRSEAKYGVRYVHFLGDGDCKSYNAVCTSKPYGELSVKKLECVGHIQKRMGSQLRKLKQQLGKTVLSDGKTIRGRLTDVTIDRLQSYYGKAIRDNTDSLDKMRTAVWASFFHTASTDAKPLHNMCSIEWCKYLKSEAAGTVDSYKHTKPIDKAVMIAIKPIYTKLADPELLSKCLHGKTQNVNESFNNTVWSRVPKNTFVGRKTLEYGVYDAVLTFNTGNVGRITVLENLGVKIGKNTATILQQLDQARVSKAKIAMENMTKQARSRRRRARLEEEADEDEDYIPGGF